MGPMNAYDLLGIEPWADEKRIRSAYRELAKRFHPDVDPSPHATERFRAIHLAYRVLLDPETRRRHDQGPATNTAHHAGQRTTTWPPRPRGPLTPPTPIQRFAFVGLHATGALFCTILIVGILIGITFGDWPLGLLLFTLPGIALLPESLQGMRGR